MYLFDNLGMALRWLRDRHGRKQYELAEAAGITKGMLCAYETGKQRPSLETLDKLLQALGADLVTLHEALSLVSRYGALQVAEHPQAEERGAYPLPESRGDTLSDLPPESLGRVLAGLTVMVRQLLEFLQQSPVAPADPEAPRTPTRHR